MFATLHCVKPNLRWPPKSSFMPDRLLIGTANLDSLCQAWESLLCIEKQISRPPDSGHPYDSFDKSGINATFLKHTGHEGRSSFVSNEAAQKQDSQSANTRSSSLYSRIDPCITRGTSGRISMVPRCPYWLYLQYAYNA